MSTIAAPRASARSLRPRFAEILRSELCKLTSVRSTYWTLAAAVAFNVGLAALLAIFLPDQLHARDKATLDTVRVTLGGSHLSQVAFGALGVLAITSEYGTGMIRATLAAVPQRRMLLAAKLVVFTGVALGIGTLSSFAAFFVFQVFVADETLRSSLGDPGVLRAVAGCGLYLTALGLLGLGLGAIIRSGAGAIAAVFSLLFVPPLLLQLLPHSWKTAIGPYAPMQAGSQIFTTHREADALAPWAGFGVLSAYAVVALAVGFILITRRDA
jgi:ABC-2 type transport system permease protein